MMQINKEEIVSILTIDNNQVPVELDIQRAISGLETYTDTISDLNEHLYDPVELLYMGTWSDEQNKFIQEIVVACEEHNCSYFRIAAI